MNDPGRDSNHDKESIMTSHTPFHSDAIKIGSTTELGRQGSAVAIGWAWTTVRGGGFGAGGYVAYIEGIGGRYGLEREFLVPDRDLSQSGRSGTITWELPTEGVIEVARFSVGSRGVQRGPLYVEIHDGRHRRITRSQISDALTRQATGYADILDVEPVEECEPADHLDRPAAEDSPTVVQATTA